MSQLATYNPPSDEKVGFALLTYSQVLKFAPQFSAMPVEKLLVVRGLWQRAFEQAGIEEQDVIPAWDEYVLSESAFPAPADIVKIARRIGDERRRAEYDRLLQERARDERNKEAEVSASELASRVADALGKPVDQVSTIDIREYFNRRMESTSARMEGTRS